MPRPLSSEPLGGQDYKMTREAEGLADFMSDLSQEAWHAIWMMYLECDLCTSIATGPTPHGRVRITSEDIAELIELSEACGGWIILDDVMASILMIAQAKK